MHSTVLTILTLVFQISFLGSETVYAEEQFDAPVAITVNGSVLELNSDRRDSIADPALADWDGDGRRDLLIGQACGRMRVLRNRASNDHPEFAEPFWFDEEFVDGRIPVG